VFSIPLLVPIVSYEEGCEFVWERCTCDRLCLTLASDELQKNQSTSFSDLGVFENLFRSNSLSHRRQKEVERCDVESEILSYPDYGRPVIYPLDLRPECLPSRSPTPLCSNALVFMDHSLQIFQGHLGVPQHAVQ
jgi:hypothetical protein